MLSALTSLNNPQTMENGMENIELFILTIVVYSMVIFFLRSSIILDGFVPLVF